MHFRDWLLSLVTGRDRQGNQNPRAKEAKPSLQVAFHVWILLANRCRAMRN